MESKQTIDTDPFYFPTPDYFVTVRRTLALGCASLALLGASVEAVDQTLNDGHATKAILQTQKPHHYAHG